MADGGICSHCVGVKENELKNIVKGKRNAPKYRKHLERIIDNIVPFILPDDELLSDIEDAFNNLDILKITQLTDMSEAIRSFRNAQVFNATLSINEKDFSNVPPLTTNENDKAREISLQLKELVSDGLGLKIPTDININQYIELLQDFRPQIIDVTGNVINSSNNNGELSINKLLKSITSINTEIERIKGLKKYMLYEAGIEFVGKNKTFVLSAFVASAMGLAGSLAGCVGVAATGAAVDHIKKKGKLKTGKSITRLSEKILNELQPNIDQLASKYIGAEIPAIQILSIRKALDTNK